MTNETITTLFEAYPTAEKFHVTSNGFAFENVNDAVNHSQILADKTILVITKGGDIESADVLDLDALPTDAIVFVDETATEDTNTDGEGETGSTGEGETGSTGEGETGSTGEGDKDDEGGEIEGDFAKYTKAELQGLCKEKGIEYNSKHTKAELIELLQAKGE
jgi:hypothetical protein